MSTMKMLWIRRGHVVVSRCKNIDEEMVVSLLVSWSCYPARNSFSLQDILLDLLSSDKAVLQQSLVDPANLECF